ncbi:hypothetical protein FXO38_20249 [Capsicum annuum]|nr:hypothetical protein FXO38_20249 [Capsicum annuum]KAF3656733.1 hypothetical protein FXO37_15319 [Capsicum annuum]
MIISYSRITPFSNGQNPNNNAIPYSTRFFFPLQVKKESTNRSTFKCKVISKNDSPYPISKLHDTAEMEVASKWRDIHVSNDEYSAQLGRRDITMAWHKTTKDVQEITDVIDLQGPARDYNMPSRDPAI